MLICPVLYLHDPRRLSLSWPLPWVSGAHADNVKSNPLLAFPQRSERQLADLSNVCRGAIFVGSGVAKGAGWLWKSGKSGVDSLKGSSGTAK